MGCKIHQNEVTLYAHSSWKISCLATNIFQDFLRKSEVGTKEGLYNHGPVVRLFVQRISLQEVFWKNAANLAPQILMSNFNKVALQLYTKITLQRRCSFVNLLHFSTHLFTRAPLGECYCVYCNVEYIFSWNFFKIWTSIRVSWDETQEVCYLTLMEKPGS